MGSGDGGTYTTIQELEPNANVLKGIPLEMSDVENGNLDEIKNWLKKLNL